MRTDNQSMVSKIQYMHPGSCADSPWDEERNQAEFPPQTTDEMLRASSEMWRAEQWHSPCPAHFCVLHPILGYVCTISLPLFPLFSDLTDGILLQKSLTIANIVIAILALCGSILLQNEW